MSLINILWYQKNVGTIPFYANINATVLLSQFYNSGLCYHYNGGSIFAEAKYIATVFPY